MREFIGHKLKVGSRTFGVIEGILVDDRPTMILIKGIDGTITRLLKQDIGGFLPTDFEPFKYVAFHVLFCENKRIGCPGVQYVKEGEGFNRGDVEVFVGPCPCRCEDCAMGTKGELRSVSGEFLRQMLAGTMFGEYPTKEKANGGSGHTAAVGTSAKGKGKGGGVLTGKQPDNG
jgi:hypothetical protein